MDLATASLESLIARRPPFIGSLCEPEAGLSVKELFRKYGFSEASYYLWRSKFGSMSVPDAKRLKELETDNG